MASNWKKWKRAFEYYAEGKGLDNARKKTSQLLHYAGMEVQDIFEDLVDPDPASNQDPYAVCIRKLDHHFRSDENIPFERHVFRQLAPTDGEPVDKFVVRLRRQARYFNFGDVLDDNLRDQLIEKLPDIELKKKLLEIRNITLAQVLEKTRASEAAGQQVKHMANASDVNAVGRKEDKPNDQLAKTCFSCGKAGHFSRKVGSVPAASCMAILQCAAETSTEMHLRQEKAIVQRAPVAIVYKAFSRQTNQVEDYLAGSSQEEDNPAFAFTVMEENEEGVCKVSTARHVPAMNVSIDGIVQAVLIDSGSVSNLMGEDDFQKLKNAGFKGNLEHCSRKLFAYGGREIEVIGQFKAEILVGNAKVTSSFVVVKCGRCVLGNATAKELGVLHIGPKASPIGGSCNEVRSDFANQLKAQYPKVFTGVGKLKDFELKLHVYPNVPPVAQK